MRRRLKLPPKGNENKSVLFLPAKNRKRDFFPLCKRLTQDNDLEEAFLRFSPLVTLSLNFDVSLFWLQQEEEEKHLFVFDEWLLQRDWRKVFFSFLEKFSLHHLSTKVRNQTLRTKRESFFESKRKDEWGGRKEGRDDNDWTKLNLNLFNLIKMHWSWNRIFENRGNF